MGTLSMSAAQVVLLLMVGTVTAVPLTDREKQNRVVAVSKSEDSLLSAALSQANPALLRVALTAADPELLETALTVSEPELLIAALNNVDPDLLAVALSKSEKDLLATALTVAKVELLRTALNAPTNAAILEVALTLSTPELLTVALQDATVENLIVALTVADGTVGTSASLLESLRSDASGKSEAYDESDESNVYDDSVESNESDESDESDESNKLESQNIVFQKASESSTTNESPVLVAQDPVNNMVEDKDFDSYPAVPKVPYGALANSFQPKPTNNEVDLPGGNPYGALSESVQSRLTKTQKKATKEPLGTPSSPFQCFSDADNEQQSKQHYTGQVIGKPSKYFIVKPTHAAPQFNSLLPTRFNGPVDAFPFFIPGGQPLGWTQSPFYI